MGIEQAGIKYAIPFDQLSDKVKAFTYLQNLIDHLTVIRGSLYTASSCPGFFLYFYG